MSSGQLLNLRSSLSIRVTSWFVGIFTLLLLLLLISFYFVIKAQLYHSADAPLLYELEEAYLTHEKKGLGYLGKHILLEAEDYGDSKVFFRVFDRYKNLLYYSDLSSWGKIPVNWTILESIRPQETISETLLLPKKNQYARIVSYGLTDGAIIQSGVYLKAELDQLARYRKLLPIIGICIVFLAAVTGFFVVRRLVLRVRDISNLADDISSSNLTERLPMQGSGDEIDELASRFNQMLDRIELLVNDVRQVSDDIAHDLRSPITRMRAGAEIALRSNQLNAEGKEVVVNTIEECDRVLTLVNSMLDISQAGAETLSLELENLDLSLIVEEAVELFEPVATDKDVTLNVQCSQGMLVKGHAKKLQRAVANLLDNAIKFTPTGGKVDLNVTTEQDHIVFTCADTGIGIAPAEIEKVFKRFYRCDNSRTTEGSGLGLTLCDSLIKVHGGKLTLESNLGAGTLVSFKLPRSRTYE